MILRWDRRAGVSCALVALGLTAATMVPGCDTGARGVDACRAIESARCDAAPACEGDDDDFGIATDVQVENCKVFYNDHCLNGIENNKDSDPDQGDTDDCVEAVNTTAACQRSGVASMADCDGVTMETGSETITPCQALHEPELMSACAFVALPPED
ncbi:MAG: hypothetical protein U0271_10380 [Polyangiaceae bacterium]